MYSKIYLLAKKSHEMEQPECTFRIVMELWVHLFRDLSSTLA